MKILFLSMDTTTYGIRLPDGNMKFDTSAEIALAERMQELGDEITLVSEREIESTIQDRLVVPLNQTITPEDIDKMSAKKYDVVFASSVSGARTANFIAERQNIPSVIELLDIPYWRLNEIWRNFKDVPWHGIWEKNFVEVKKASHIIVNTTPSVQALKKELGEDFVKEKVSLVYYGVDDKIADDIPRLKKVNDIVFISTLRFYKGVNILLYVAYILKNKYKLNPKITIIGVGDELFNLLQTSVMLGVNVGFAGGVSNKEKFSIIKASKVNVQLHFDEHIGTAVCLESLYCKVPVVTWDLLINTERFGTAPFYIERFNLMQAAEKVYNILINTVDDTRLQEGKEFVAKNRTFSVTAKQIHDILLKQITKRK